MKRIPLFGLGLIGLAPGAGLVLALVTTLASADSQLTRQPRTVPAFHGVELAGTLEVQVTVGKPASVEVSGDADLVDKVTTTVRSGVLVIDTRELRHIHRRNLHLRASVTVPDLDSLALSGVGTLKVAGVASDQLAIDLSGTGAITAAGTTGTLRVVVDGTGEVTTNDLSAKDVAVTLGGTGSAVVRATRSVDARVTGTGSVNVHGHPSQIQKSVSGLGSVHVD